MIRNQTRMSAHAISVYIVLEVPSKQLGEKINKQKNHRDWKGRSKSVSIIHDMIWW